MTEAPSIAVKAAFSAAAPYLAAPPREESAPQFDDDDSKNVSGIAGADQTVAAHYEYAPFGSVLSTSGASAASNPFRFSSEYADDALGLVYYNYRHYNPLDGRWLRRDPIGELSEFNLHAYCRNSCTDYVDALGLKKHRCNFIIYAGHYNEAITWIKGKKKELLLLPRNEKVWYGVICCFRDDALKFAKQQLPHNYIKGLPAVPGMLYKFEEVAKKNQADYLSGAFRKALAAAESAAQDTCRQNTCCKEIDISFECSDEAKQADESNYKKEKSVIWQKNNPGQKVVKWCAFKKTVGCKDARRRKPGKAGR